MAFSLGSIFVELTCNTAKFLTGMDKASVAAKKTGKDIRSGLGEVSGSLALLGESGERVGSILQLVGDKASGAFDVAADKGRGFGILAAGSLLGGVTALAGGMFALAKRSAEVGSQIFEAQEKTGIAASQLSGIMAIAKQTGGNFDGLSTALARAGANLSKALIEPGKITSKILIQAMGGARQFADMGLKPMGDRLQSVLAHIFAMNDEGARNAALSALLGKGWMENVSSLKLLAEQGYGPAIAAAKKMGVFFDDAAAANARKFSVELKDMEAQASGLGLSIGTYLLPVIKQFVEDVHNSLPYIDAEIGGFKALALALSLHFSEAKKEWNAAKATMAGADQAQTDWLVTMQAFTDGAKSSGEATKGLAGAAKEYRDVLAGIISRERDELSTLDVAGNKYREIQAEYDKTVREIQKAVAAGGSIAESYQAQTLALDIYIKKLGELALAQAKSLTQMPSAAIGAPPTLQTPEGLAAVKLGPSALGGGMPAMGNTLSQLARLASQTDSTRGEERALREETELSDAAFQKLAKAFPGLTEAEVAATAAGRRMIAQLTEMDKLGTASEQFTEFKNRLIADGNDIAGHLIQTMGGALSQLEDQIAHLTVTGKANFKQVYQGIEEGILKTGMQKGVSTVLGAFGLGGKGGGKPDGSSGNPLWTRSADRAPALMPGGAPTAGGAPAPAPSGVQGVIQQAASGLGSVGKMLGGLGGIFGGFLEKGGDVRPGKAYVVGEKHPEFFVPHGSGTVVPSVKSESLRPLVYSPTFNVSTPNADSFRRSQSQLLHEGYQQMAATHARNS